MGLVRASGPEGLRFTTFREIDRAGKAFLKGVCHARIVPDCVGGKKWLCRSCCQPVARHHLTCNGMELISFSAGSAYLLWPVSFRGSNDL